MKTSPPGAPAKSLAICLDARYKTESGSSSYVRHVVPGILEQGRSHRFFLVKYAAQRFEFESRMEEVLVSPSSDLGSMLWTVGVLPFLLKSRNMDLYHALKMPGPFWNPVPSVGTMHSIVSRYRGEFPTTFRASVHRRVYAEPMLRRTAHWIAVSEFVRQCLTDQYGVDPARIDVIYHGIDPAFRPLEPAQIEASLRKYSLREPYVLCVGNVFPVKNHVTAVRAFARIAAETDLHLVIAGGQGDPYFGSVVEEVERSGLAKRIHLPGFVRGEDLVALMNGAQVMLMPSLTEGCPVTLLEAFGCGLPVIAAKRGGLWDLGQNSCLFVDDPMDHAGFAEQLRRVLGSGELREELRRKSLRRAKDFSWSGAARAHLRAYVRALSAPDGGDPAQQESGAEAAAPRSWDGGDA